MKKIVALFIPLFALASGLSQIQIRAANDPIALGSAWQKSVAAEQSADYTEALKQLAVFSQNGGDQFLALLRAGWLSYLDKKYDKAIEYYAAANRIQPMAINALLGLLNAAQAKNDANAIKRAAENILRVDPLNYRAQMALANSEFSAARYQQASAFYRRALSVYPDDLDATSGAAWSAYYLNNRRDAEIGFRKILSVNPDYSYAARGLELVTGKQLSAMSR